MSKNKSVVKRGIENNNLKKKLGEKCVYCGCENKLILTIDHKLPTSRGGKDIDKNKQVTCWTCNQLKGSLTHSEFKNYLNILYKLKGLNKIKLQIEKLNLLFCGEGFPKTLKDLEVKRCGK